MSAAAGTIGPERPSLVSALRPRWTATLSIWLATAGLFLISWAAQPQSVSESALRGMLPFAAILAIVAAGQTLVIQQGGIDLSVPGMISLTVILLTRLPDGDNSKLWWAVLIAFAAIVGAGILTGLIVTYVQITPIVTTLGMNALLFGAVLYISGGTPRDTTPRLQSIVTAEVGGVQVSVIVAVVVIAVLGFLVKRTTLGRRFEATGSSHAAARAAGLDVARYRVMAYAGASFLYLIGGILLAGVVKTPSAFQGEQYLLPSVAAVVLGGTSLLGGVGSVVATAGGALFLTQLQQLVLTTGVAPAVQYLIQAGAIAVGTGIHGLRRRRGGRIATPRAANGGTPGVDGVSPDHTPDPAGSSDHVVSKGGRET